MIYVLQNDTLITLTYYIQDVDFEHEGEFSCHAEDGDFTEFDSTNIAVYGMLNYTFCS